MTARAKQPRGRQLPVEEILALYRTMLAIRGFEETVRKLHLAGEAPGIIHLGIGQEAVAAGVCAALGTEDHIASHHRGHGHCIAKGGNPARMFAELTGKRTGYGMGRGGSMHIYDPVNGNLGTNAIVGGGVPLATGAALSAKLQGSGRVAVAFFGDGALNQGILFECMNMAAVWSLPVIYVCEDNRYGEFTESSTVTAGRYPDRGKAFAIPSLEVDGMDVLAVREAAAGAIGRARDGGGPTFLICETYRYTGHHISDKQDYKAAAEQEEWRKRDPIARLRRQLLHGKHATDLALSALEDQVSLEISEAAAAAAREPVPGPDSLMEHLYASGS